MSACRAAVIGAGGIGKFHSQWYDHHGCDVVAFVGSSDASTAKTEALLRERFGFAGRRYWDLDRMLDEARPDLVSVCSPAVLHRDHARRCLDHGVHVLCEKPFVWQDPPDASVLLGQCDELANLARQRDRVLAVNTQYVSMLDAFYELAGDRLTRAWPTEMTWVMEIRDRGYQPIGLLCDTVSHPLSVLIALGGGGDLHVSDVHVDWRAKGLSVAFVATVDGSACRCSWRFDQVPGPAMDRLLSVDGFEAHLGYTKEDDAGIVRTVLSTGDRHVTIPDMMSESSRRFVSAVGGQGTPLVDARASRQNLRLHLELLDAVQAQA